MRFLKVGIPSEALFFSSHKLQSISSPSVFRRDRALCLLVSAFSLLLARGRWPLLGGSV
jgi:hypothetical protein